MRKNQKQLSLLDNEKEIGYWSRCKRYQNDHQPLLDTKGKSKSRGNMHSHFIDIKKEVR